MRNKYCQRLARVFFIFLVIGLSGCSDADDDMEPETEPERTIDLAEFSGKYRGTWSWDFGTGTVVSSISLEIAASTSSEHAVNFYESQLFSPSFNSDGMTPEAIGTITTMANNQVTIDLDLKTDAPLCLGDYTGSGTRNDQGRLILNMDIVHDCAQDNVAVFNLVKIAEL